MRIGLLGILVGYIFAMHSCSQNTTPINFYNVDPIQILKLDSCFQGYSISPEFWQQNISQINIHNKDTCWLFDMSLKDSMYWDETVKDFGILSADLSNKILDSVAVEIRLIFNNKFIYTVFSKTKTPIHTTFIQRVEMTEIKNGKDSTYSITPLWFEIAMPVTSYQGGKISDIILPITESITHDYLPYSDDSLSIEYFKNKGIYYIDIPIAPLSSKVITIVPYSISMQIR